LAQPIFRRARRDKIVADHETERLTPEFLRGGRVEGFGGSVGVDAFRESSGRTHAFAPRTLGGRRHVVIETRDTRHDDLVAVGFENGIAHPTADGGYKGRSDIRNA
jgi:hypothetical protein